MPYPPFWKPFKPLRLRQTPDVFAVEQLRAIPGRGAFPKDTGTTGKRWVIVTGLVPYKKQLDEYRNKFLTAASSDPAQDVPKYWGFFVQKAEVVPGAKEEPKWSKSTFVGRKGHGGCHQSRGRQDAGRTGRSALHSSTTYVALAFACRRELGQRSRLPAANSRCRARGGSGGGSGGRCGAWALSPVKRGALAGSRSRRHSASAGTSSRGWFRSSWAWRQSGGRRTGKSPTMPAPSGRFAGAGVLAPALYRLRHQARQTVSVSGLPRARESKLQTWKPRCSMIGIRGQDPLIHIAQ